MHHEKTRKEITLSITKMNRLPHVLIQHIIDFCVEPIYQFREWVNMRNIDWKSISKQPRAIDFLTIAQHYIHWDAFSSNPKAIPLLEANRDKINWFELSSNPSAIPLLEANMDKINWMRLSMNREAIPLLERNIDKIEWYSLSTNPHAMSIIEANMDKVHWGSLCTNPAAIHLLEANQDKIDWYRLSSNPSAMSLLQKNPSKINWMQLSMNPRAVPLLQQQQRTTTLNWLLAANPNILSVINDTPIVVDQFSYEDWFHLSRNPGAIDFLEQHPYHIDWKGFSDNPEIFEINHDETQTRAVEIVKQFL